MTWSICLHDAASGVFAVAVATRAFAVGASCPFLRAGVGAVSTQSITNRYLGPVVLDGLARGLSAERAVRAAIASDAGAGLRQLHAVDRQGGAFAWTGENCVDWCGSLAAPGISLAGNMLAGPQVLEATRAALLDGTALPLAERLVAAMAAGEAAGGDKRGRQSAALKLIGTEDFPDIDLRVDDHADPLAELSRLLCVWRRDGEPRLATAPRRADPAGLIDFDTIEAGWASRGLALRLRR